MTQPTAEQLEVTQDVKAQHAIAMADIDKNFGVLSAATSGTARLILAHMLGQTAAIQSTEARMAEAVEAERERTSWGVMCGDNPSQIPADMVGCGKPIMGPSQTYRCTHCDVPFHKACAEKHFQSDNVLTEEMVDEIERREAIRSRSNG